MATQPCPCGFRGTRTSECRCDDAAVERYLAKLSGPLLDRIDLQIEVARIPFDEMISAQRAEPSSTIRGRVVAARERQQQRFIGSPFLCKGEIPGAAVRTHCTLDTAGSALLRTACTQRRFSARAFDRIARVARTIGDLAASETNQAEHVAEAIMYRSLERLGRAA